MIRAPRGAAAAVILALGCAAGTASAQAADGFDLSALEIPPGFLDLTDVALATGSHGDVIAVGTTVLGNARAKLLLAIDPSVGLRDGMTLAIKPEAWKLTEAIPALSNPILDGIDFSNVALVLASADREMYSDELTDDEWYFYREVYGADEFRLTLRPGVNLIAAIPAGELEPDHPMNIVMDALGIEKGTILIQGGLGRSLSLLGGGGGAASAVRDMYLRAELPPVRPPGSPEWFRGGQLALELTGDPSVRFVGELSIAIDDDVLDFFVATSLARTGMALTGGLLAEDGWEQPFGIEWLVFRGVVLQLAITPTGSIQPGFAASMIIGEKDIDVAVALAISPAGVPTNLMFRGESEAGVALADLVQLQAQMAAARQAAADAVGSSNGDAPGPIPLDALPDVALRDLELGFASKDAPELGIERGFKLAGRLWLPLSSDGELTDFAGVDVDVSEAGIIARGDLGAFELGPLVWNDAALDLTATREDQHLMVKGEVEMFGSRQLVDLSVARESMSFRSETNIFDMFTADIVASAELNLRRPDFQVDAVVHADFGDAVGPLAQDAIAQFAATGGDVIAAASDASQAAAAAVADAQATADELRQVLEAQRRMAEDRLQTAQQDAARARNAMRSALAARNRALRSYYATPSFPVWRKAQRLAAYRAAHARYRARAIQHTAAATRVTVRQRILRAIPPVDRNVLMLGAEELLAELRARLRTMQQELDRMETQLTAISEAVERGEQLLVIERAEFHGGLQAAMNGQAIRWDIVGQFVGEAFEIHRVMDFTDPGAGAAAMLQELIGP